MTDFRAFLVTLLSRETQKNFLVKKAAVFFPSFQYISSKGLDKGPENNVTCFALLFNRVSVERILIVAFRNWLKYAGTTAFLSLKLVLQALPSIGHASYRRCIKLAACFTLSLPMGGGFAAALAEL